jgi:hypothetical protein
MKLYTTDNYGDVLLSLPMSDFHFLIIGTCKSISLYFKSLPATYPPKNYTELNGILKLCSFLGEVQEKYLDTPNHFYLFNKETKEKINEALNIFTNWKKEHREEEIKQQGTNFGSALPYNNWNPNELNEKFLKS